MGEKIIVSIDPDLEDLIPGFLNNRRNDVAIIREHLENGDLDAIRMLGHSMKGAGGGYGFDRITEIGGAMEEAALAGDTSTIVKCNDDLDDYLSRVETVPES